jgi:hypothetical protein
MTAARNTRVLPNITAAELRSLLAVDRAIARVLDTIETATAECRAHPRLAGVSETILALTAAYNRIDAAHPAHRLLPSPRGPAEEGVPEADDEGITL